MLSAECVVGCSQTTQAWWNHFKCSENWTVPCLFVAQDSLLHHMTLWSQWYHSSSLPSHVNFLYLRYWLYCMCSVLCCWVKNLLCVCASSDITIISLCSCFFSADFFSIFVLSRPVLFPAQTERLFNIASSENRLIVYTVAAWIRISLKLMTYTVGKMLMIVY